MASRSGAITGGVFVVSLTLLLFLFNGDIATASTLFPALTPYQSYIEQILVYLVILGFGATAMKSEGFSFAGIGASKKHLATALPVLGALAVVTFGVSAANGDFTLAMGRLESGMSPLVLLGAICFGSFVEEYIFRGYVQNGTTRRFGVKAGIIVSAAVFALAHVPTDLSGLSPSSGASVVVPFLAFSAIGRFFFGVVAFSTLYYLTGNFFLTFFIHAFYNISVFFLAPPDGSLVYRSVLIGVPYIAVLALSGRYGFPQIRSGTDTKAGAGPITRQAAIREGSVISDLLGSLRRGGSAVSRRLESLGAASGTAESPPEGG